MDGKANGRQHLTGAELLRGGRSFKSLEIPEITDENGAPKVVHLRPLRTSDVLGFVDKVKRAGQPRLVGKDEPDAGDSGIQQMLVLISKTVCDESGELLFTPEQAGELRDLDMRIFTRLSKAITNMMNDRPLDYVEPPAGSDEKEAPVGNGSGGATPETTAPTASGSPTA